LANHKSAIKRMLQGEKRHARNRHVKSTIKTHIKKYLKTVEEKNNDAALESLKSAESYIRKAAAKGVIHKRNASRKISRLTRKYNALSSSSS
jgi:small subunit ribosomal protein S20